MRSWITYCVIVFVFSNCAFEEDPKLESVEDRVLNSKKELNEALLSPPSGWKINYQPTNSTGKFLILMNFQSDGTVTIQSDITANNGEFREQTIPYRIDASQGIELILETYGAFHYLFELNQASFGGEFEFLFSEFDNEDLVFKSKTDVGDITELRFTPADANDESLISTESLIYLEQGIFQTQNLGNIGGYGNYSIYIPEQNHSISLVLDLNRRVLLFSGAATGQTLSEISILNEISKINQSVEYSFESGAIQLEDQITFSHENIQYSISEIPLNNPARTDTSFCDGVAYSATQFNSENSVSFSEFEMKSTLFQAQNNFKSIDGFYSINHNFLYDENDNSLAGQIEEFFPNVVVFQWYQGFEISTDSILNAVGFATVDELNNVDFFLRGFDFVQVGNHIEMSFNGSDLISNENATQQQKDALYNLTDEIFSGGSVYMLELLNIDGLYEFYNPCNRYKGFIL